MIPFLGYRPRALLGVTVSRIALLTSVEALSLWPDHPWEPGIFARARAIWGEPDARLRKRGGR